MIDMRLDHDAIKLNMSMESIRFHDLRLKPHQLRDINGQELFLLCVEVQQSHFACVPYFNSNTADIAAFELI